MTSTSTAAQKELAEILQKKGPWASVYVDVSSDRGDPVRLNTSRQDSTRHSLKQAGLGEGAIDAVVESLEYPPSLPNPLTRFVLATDDGIVYAEDLQGAPRLEVEVSSGPLPVIVPFLERRPLEFRYLVVEMAAAGGSVALFSARGRAAERVETDEATADPASKVRKAGHVHFRNLEHTAELWRRNESALAHAVDAAVDADSPRLVVIHGETRGRQELIDSLSTAARALVRELPLHQRDQGDVLHQVPAFVSEQSDSIAAAELEASLEALRQDDGRPGGYSTEGIETVAEALREAQVDTLFLAASALEGQTLFALDAQPWIALTESDAAPAGVVGLVPAAEALARAAILTDATVRIVSPEQLRGPSVAAILRWQEGPEGA